MNRKTLFIATVAAVLPVCAWSADRNEVLLFSFFRDNGQNRSVPCLE